MIKRLMLAVVGVAMGGLAGLVVAAFVGGGAAIITGAILGGVIFFFAIPALLDRTGG